jgi:hypothetical protein
MPLKLPQSYSRTLAVVGRFRSDRDEDESNGVFVFENGSSKASGPLSATDVFAVLKPELRLLDSASVWVDDVAYYSLRLQGPDAEAKGGSLPIGPDSVLLEQVGSGAAYSDRSRATIGGALMDSMLHDLDIIARMSGSSFPNALLELAHRYLNVDVNTRLKDNLTATQIDAAFRDDPVVTGRILDLLIAFEADVPGARKALRTALQAFDIRGRSAKDITEIIEGITGSVERLRRQLETGVYDGSWDTVVGRAPNWEMPWVADLSKGDDRYKVELGDIGVNVGATLRDAYVLYRERAGRLHKLVRAPSLHSYVFIWLMSKYGNLIEGQPQEVAKAAYERGVKGAGSKRIFGETPENTAKRKKIAGDEAQRKITEYANLGGFAGFAEQLIPDIRDVVLIENTFRRSDLLQRLERLFVQLSGAISGPAAAALDETRKAIKAYGPVYQGLVNVLNASDAAAWDETALTSAIEATGKATQAIGIKAAVAAAQKSLKDKVAGESEDARRERIRASTLDAFTKAVSAASIDMFADKYRANPGIAAQAQQLAQLYGAAGLVTGRQDLVSDAPAAVLTAPPPQGKITDAGKARLEKSLAGTTSAAAPARLPLPNSMVDTLPAGKQVNYEVRDGSNKTVGTAKATQAEGIEIEFKEDVSDLSNLKLVPPDEAPPLSLKTVDPEGRTEAALKQGRNARAERAKAVEGLGQLGEYAKKREEIRRFYVNPGKSPMSASARAAFQRGLRTLTLGEFIASAPDRESRLGSPTISETLKLLLDISEGIGDLNNPDLKEPRPDTASAEALGPETPGAGPDAQLNLSAYFRLPSGPDSDIQGPEMIQKSMAYHRSLADSVQQASAFLGDLADLKAIADAAAPNAKLIVVNRTLAEYTRQALQGGGQMLTRDLHPATLYLPRAAKADGEAWGVFGEAFTGNYADDTDGAAQLSCPMVISAEGDTLPGCPFPVASLARVRDLKLRVRPQGQQPLTPATGGKPPTGHAFSTMDHGLIVDGGAWLSVPAAMAAATIVSNEMALGTLSPDKPSFDFRKAFQQQVKMPYVEGETIVALLRRLWLQPETNSCLPALAVSSLATLALIAGSGPGAPDSLKALLAVAQLAQGKVEEHDLNAAQRAAFDSAVLPNGARFAFLADRTDVAQDNYNHRLFKTSKPISLQVQPPRGTAIVAIIDQALCQPLNFLNV